MKIGRSGPAHRLAGGFFWLFSWLVLGIAPHAYGAKFWHAASGAIEVYTSDTPDSTKHLLAELLEVRRQVQELVAPVPLPNPRLQLLVFNRTKEYEEFLPPQPEWEKNTTRVSGFRSSEFALVMAVVREGDGYEFGRETLRYFYASFLLNSVVPKAPLWIKVGLPEFLGATEWRGNRIYIGGDFMNHLSSVRLSKLMPLAQLMDDEAVGKYYGLNTHDNVLYHESWALWHRWMTDSDPRRRVAIRRLLAAVRDGEPGSLATVAACFGESDDTIEAARRTSARGRGFGAVVANSDVASLVSGFEFKPATDLDARFAQALLCGVSGQGPQQLAYELYRLAQAEPQSPRPAEALAILATGENDGPKAEARWENARDLGTGNPYAYLQPARAALADRHFQLASRPQLPAALCETWRQYLTRCVELDPGCVDGNYYRLLVEAFAPDPVAATVDAVERSQVLLVRPQGGLYLAIARWRLGQVKEARQALDVMRENRRRNDGLRQAVAALSEAIRKDSEKKTE